jgi:L-asparaginase II
VPGVEPPALVAVTRAGWPESVHRVHIAVCDAAGDLLAAAGDPWRVAFMRSAAKPLQALPLVESGAAATLALEPQHLAIACASHRGLPLHTAAATELLARAGLDPGALRCGVHPPEDREAAAALQAAGRAPERLHNNCSGKHAGMLAASRHRGWPLEGYLEADHPLQREIAAIVAEVSRAAPALGVDGCGVPTFALPLAAMATAFARFGCGRGLAAPRAAAAERLASAMAAHPDLIAGPGHVNSVLLALHGDALVAKGGAEGVWCAALRGDGPGLGIAVKVEDGADRASAVAMLAVLDALGLPGGADPRLDAHRHPVIMNTLGAVVGGLAVELPAGFGARGQGPAVGA